MIHVRLDQFEGPLGLLLFLIRKDEMDIYDIPINKITTQYLEYLKRMRELDLEVAGEFVAMAATLILIKSKMLLPQYNENGELIEDVLDPRKELVQRLIEYQMYQEASKQLNERPLLGRDVWARGAREEIPTEEGDIIVDEGGLFALISIYRKVMKQVHKNVHNVRAKGQSIAGRILEIKDRLIPGSRITLRDLISPVEMSANKVLITFLSLLELTKMGFTTLFQTENYGDIYIDTKKTVERNVIDRVEEYDRKPEDLQAVAAALVADAGGRNLQDIGENLSEALSETSEGNDGAGASGASQMGEQLGLDMFAPPEQVATDDDILAAEAEMGVAEGAVDLDRVDRILANFTMDAETRETNSRDAATPNVTTPVATASTEIESATDENVKLDPVPEAMSALDLALKAFEQAVSEREVSKEKPVETETIELSAELPAEQVLIETEKSVSISGDDFEMAWASFEETLPSTQTESVNAEVSQEAPAQGEDLLGGAFGESAPADNTSADLPEEIKLAGEPEATRPTEEPKTPEQKVASLVESAKASMSLFDDEPEDFVIKTKPEMEI